MKDTLDERMGIPKFGADVLRRLFARRHESPEMRWFARAAIRDARLWRRIFGEARRQP